MHRTSQRLYRDLEALYAAVSKGQAGQRAGLIPSDDLRIGDYDKYFEPTVDPDHGFEDDHDDDDYGGDDYGYEQADDDLMPNEESDDVATQAYPCSASNYTDDDCDDDDGQGHC